MASTTAKYAPKFGRPSEWIVVPGNGTKKGSQTSNVFPASVKNIEESKRQVICHRSPGSPSKSSFISQDILHAIKMKNLSMKVPAHLRSIKSRYNDRGNVTGMTTAQTTVESMLLRFGEICLQIALRLTRKLPR